MAAWLWASLPLPSVPCTELGILLACLQLRLPLGTFKQVNSACHPVNGSAAHAWRQQRWPLHRKEDGAQQTRKELLSLLTPDCGPFLHCSCFLQHENAIFHWEYMPAFSSFCLPRVAGIALGGGQSFHPSSVELLNLWSRVGEVQELRWGGKILHFH